MNSLVSIFFGFAAHHKWQVQKCSSQSFGEKCRTKNFSGKFFQNAFSRRKWIEIIWSDQGVVIRRKPSNLPGNKQKRVCDASIQQRAWWNFVIVTFQIAEIVERIYRYVSTSSQDFTISFGILHYALPYCQVSRVGWAVEGWSIRFLYPYKVLLNHHLMSKFRKSIFFFELTSQTVFQLIVCSSESHSILSCNIKLTQQLSFHLQDHSTISLYPL